MRFTSSLLPLLAALCACSSSQPSNPAGNQPAGQGGTRDYVPSNIPPEAFGKTAANAPVAGLIPLAWHDGERERQATLDPRLIAEFEPTEANQTRLLAAEPRAVLDSQPAPVVRFWRVGPDTDVRALVAGLNQSGGGRFSPVFWDGTVGFSQRMALPGGVLAGFPADWSAEDVTAYASQNGLILGARLSELTSIWNVVAPAGLPSLELANQLRAGGVLRYAHPNWWTETKTR
jgi:hypothetical protein